MTPKKIILVINIAKRREKSKKTQYTVVIFQRQNQGTNSKQLSQKRGFWNILN
jgi:hypothetical protein